MQHLKAIEDLKPKKVMVFYSSVDTNYVEIRDVNKEGKLLAGKPASIKTLSFIKDIVTIDEEREELIIDEKPNKFFWLDNTSGKTLIAWTVPEEERTITVNGKPYFFNVPKTFWVYNGKNTYVYAYKKFKHFKTVLYRMPTPNVYDNGDICWGNSKMIINSNKLSMLKSLTSTRFWESEFNNHLQSGLPCDANMFYSMSKSQQNDKLIAHGRNIKDVLDALS